MKKEKLFKGKLFEINAYHMQVEHRKVRREIIEHPGAAAMLAFDEKGKVLLVKQHRFPPWIYSRDSSWYFGKRGKAN